MVGRLEDPILTYAATVKNLESAARVRNAIASASSRTGVSFDYLLQQARVESDYDPAAKAKTSSASGLYQFTRQTWLATVKSHGAAHGLGWAADAITKSGDGRFHVADPDLRRIVLELRNAPEAASNMAAAFASDNDAILSAQFGRKPLPVDLYLAHFLGPSGAARFLTAHAANPGAPASLTFPAAAAANRRIFHADNGRPHSFDEVRQLLADKLQLGRSAGPHEAVPLTAPPPTTQRWMPTHSAAQNPANEEGPRPMRLLNIEPMPARLSLGFASRAYERLAAMPGGANA